MSSFLGPQLMATRSHALPLQPAANQNQLYKGDCLFAHLPDAVCNSKTVNLRQLHEAMGHLQPHPWACRRQQFCPCAWFLLKPLTELPLCSWPLTSPQHRSVSLLWIGLPVRLSHWLGVTETSSPLPPTARVDALMAFWMWELACQSPLPPWDWYFVLFLFFNQHCNHSLGLFQGSITPMKSQQSVIIAGSPRNQVTGSP